MKGAEAQFAAPQDGEEASALPAFPMDLALAGPASQPLDGLPAPARAANQALQETLYDLASRFGLQGGHYVHLGHAIRTLREGHAPQVARFIATSVSDRRLYLEEGALACDPVALRIAAAHRPFAWTSPAEVGASDGRRALAQRLKGRGVYGGIAAPVHDYAAGPAYLSLYSAYSGEAEQLIAKHGAELTFAAFAFHEEAKAQILPFSHTGALTAREMDCLRLAALGQTVTETAHTLKVTARTVEFHLKNAAEKLGAPNKLRAVILAAGRGLISV
jgi:LuxR family transcriptional activator of conjugal transfer of Ti plasmids